MDHTVRGKESILNQVFGFQSFRGSQSEIIDRVIDNQNNLVIMPTGGGKSLCYQIPAIIKPGMAIVISPLIALMKDQVEALRANGVEAGAINSSTDPAESKRVIDSIEGGTLKLLYISPERAVTDRFIQYIGTKHVSLIAIDEAHCVSIWGNDFRPEYTQLTKLTSEFKEAPVIALTATADYATQQDILKQLDIRDAHVDVSSFERSNIYMEVRPALSRVDQIKRYLLDHQDASGIIYCLSRKSTETLAKKLTEIGIAAAPYHARLERGLKDETQNKFQSDEIKVVCATIAFGMGIDKSNISFVIHYNLPKNIEAYYQEIGRAGRDGQPAEAILFAGFNDVATFRTMIDDSDANESFKRVQTQKLDRIWEFSQASNCRTNIILNYFGEIKTTPCGHCDNCQHPPETIDGTEIAQMALSAIVRTRESVGVQLLVDILRGSFRSEIREGGYEQIKTFGIGREIPRIHWIQYVIQLANHGAVAIDYTNGARLKMTSYGYAILKSDATIRLTEPRDYKKSGSKPMKVRKISKAELFQNGLHEHLKMWRAQLAKVDKVSPVNILPDKALLDMSVSVPMFLADLHEIDGFSAIKLKKYARSVLDSIHQYILRQKHKKSIKGKSLMDTYLLYKAGKSVKEIEAKREIAKSTVFKHIGDLILKDEAIAINDFVSNEQIEKVSNILEKHQCKAPEDVASYITEVIGLHEIGLIMSYLTHLNSKS